MAQTPVTLRRTPVALATALVLIAGTLAYGLNTASAVSAVRRFSATLQSPACIKAGTRGTFVATFKNDSTSNQPLGSAKIDSDDNATSFTGIANIAITSAPTGKTWTAGPDHANPDGVILKATSSSSALSPGQSVSVTFTAVAPSTGGITKTWKTFAWQTTSYSTSFTRTSPYPTTPVSTTCVGPPTTITFETGPSPTTSGGTMADVKVKVTDGTNVLSGQSVTLSSAGLATSPTPAVATDINGIATFSGSALTVKPGVGSFGMTATSGALNVSANFSITVGTPAYVTFTNAGQPTDTLVTDADHGTNPIKGQGGGGVEVRVEDSNHNPISGMDVTMTIGSSFATGGHLGGDPTVPTVDGIATFSDLTIDLSSSGYRLHAEAGGVEAIPKALSSRSRARTTGARTASRYSPTGDSECTCGHDAHRREQRGGGLRYGVHWFRRHRDDHPRRRSRQHPGQVR